MWAGESARGDPVLVDQHLSLCHFGHLYFPLFFSCSFPAQPSRLCLCPFPPPGWNLLVECPCQPQARSLRAKGEHHQQLYNWEANTFIQYIRLYNSRSTLRAKAQAAGGAQELTGIHRNSVNEPLTFCGVQQPNPNLPTVPEQLPWHPPPPDPQPRAAFFCSSLCCSGGRLG